MAKKRGSKGKKKTTKVKKTVKKTVKPKVKNKGKKKPTEVRYHSTKEIKVEKTLVDNFIALQKVMVNLSSKFDRLSDEISKLLNIFEVSAKAMAKKEFASEKDPGVKKIIDKLDNISQQSGLIGKGLALIHEVSNEQQDHIVKNFEPQSSPMMSKHPLGKSMSPRPQIPNRNPGMGQMQPSIMGPGPEKPNRPMTNSDSRKEMNKTPAQNKEEHA